MTTDMTKDTEALREAAKALRRRIDRVKFGQSGFYVAGDASFDAKVADMLDALATPASDVAPVASAQDAVAWWYRNETRPANSIIAVQRWALRERPGWTETPLYAHPPHPQSVDPVAGEALREDQVEVAAMAFAKAFYGSGFDPFTNPEAYAMAEDATRAALSALKGPAA